MSTKKETIVNKSQLKTGDVLVRRNGEIEIYIQEFSALIGANGRYRLADGICDDLTYITPFSKQFDVVKVYRPSSAYNCDLKEGYLEGNLIYDRDSITVEMTIEEVCKALGKNIKIVKGDK